MAAGREKGKKAANADGLVVGNGSTVSALSSEIISLMQRCAITAVGHEITPGSAVRPTAVRTRPNEKTSEATVVMLREVASAMAEMGVTNAEVVEVAG